MRNDAVELLALHVRFDVDDVWCLPIRTPQAVVGKMWCVPELNERYIANMEDVLAIYEKPYNPKQPVVCLDEKPITLHADVRPATAAKPGREARRDSEYERRGNGQCIPAVEPKAGRHFCFPTRDRSGFQVAQVVLELAMSYPKATRIHLVMDNLNKVPDRRLRTPDRLADLAKVRHPLVILRKFYGIPLIGDSQQVDEGCEPCADLDFAQKARLATWTRLFQIGK